MKRFKRKELEQLTGGEKDVPVWNAEYANNLYNILICNKEEKPKVEIKEVGRNKDVFGNEIEKQVSDIKSAVNEYVAKEKNLKKDIVSEIENLYNLILEHEGKLENNKAKNALNAVAFSNQLKTDNRSLKSAYDSLKNKVVVYENLLKGIKQCEKQISKISSSIFEVYDKNEAKNIIHSTTEQIEKLYEKISNASTENRSTMSDIKSKYDNHIVHTKQVSDCIVFC